MRLFFHWVLCIHLSLYSGVAFSDSWQLCYKPSLVPKSPTNPTDRSFLNDSLTDTLGKSTLYAVADHMQNFADKSMVLQGNVALARDQDQLFTETLTINKDYIIADTPVHYQTNDEVMTATSVKLKKVGTYGIFNDAELFMPSNNVSISAQEIEQLNDSNKRLRNIRYTTCDPNKPTWHMLASTMQLNEDSGRGTARDVQLRLFNIPLIYIPAFSFPIDDRRMSGFLYPSLGNSNDSGFEVAIPWYWNIAPQADATLGARYMSKRGVQLTSTWRYLNRFGLNEFFSEHVNDRQFGNKRWLYHFSHQAQYTNNWSTELHTYNVADPEYLDELNSPFKTNDDYLQRIFELKKSAYTTKTNWEMSLLAQDYEFADAAANNHDAPFELAPQLTFIANTTVGQYFGTFNSQLTQFAHATKTTTGKRWIHQLVMQRKFGNSGWFVQPRINAHLSRYQLDNGEQFSRNIPISSVDSGLFFDRLSPDWQQTLEPRLFLLHVPYRDQEALPNYDTSLASLNYNQLFATNRFNGQDRIGDTQQATVGLTSRVYKRDTNQQVLQLQIGQSYYQREQQTTLHTGNSDTRSKSAVFTTATWQFANHWELHNTIQWPNTENHIRDSRFSLQYRRDNDHLLYISHNKNNLDLEEIDINGRWRIHANWTAFGKYQYDLLEQQNIHRFIGLEYESCCITFRVVTQQQLEDGDQSRGISLQLSLKGLSTIGKLENSIAEGIHGFYDDL